MQSRDCEVEVRSEDLVLRSPANWTAVGFLAMLAALHLANAVPALLAGRWAGSISLFFALLLLLATFFAFRCRCELAFLGAARRVRVRTGVGWFCNERLIPFRDIRGVRITAETGSRERDMLIELLCRGEDIPCPPSKIPRQQALYLAMLIGVPLIKVSEDDLPIPPEAGRMEPSVPSRSLP